MRKSELMNFIFYLSPHILQYCVFFDVPLYNFYSLKIYKFLCIKMFQLKWEHYLGPDLLITAIARDLEVTGGPEVTEWKGQTWLWT